MFEMLKNRNVNSFVEKSYIKISLTNTRCAILFLKKTQDIVFLILTSGRFYDILYRHRKKGEAEEVNIQGFQKMTLLDFPGKTACTVFTGGCNLRCPFCHNADLVRHPMERGSLEGEVLEYLKKRRGLIDGVCITGGEPLLRPDLAEFIRCVKDMGYAVKLDTNGRLPDRLEQLLQTGLLDYVAMDLKHQPARYSAAVGCEADPEPFLRSIRILEAGATPHEFRTTAVKGIHEPQDFGIMASLLLPQTPYYIQCFRDSGNLLGQGCGAFSEEELAECLQYAKKAHQNTYIRG